jgi:hypothetical protein
MRCGEIIDPPYLEVALKKMLLTLALLSLPLAAITIIETTPSIAAAKTSKLGDLSSMRTIVAETLALVNAGDIKGAIKRVTDFETAWDKNSAKLKKRDAKLWNKVDGASDVALSTVRYPSATPDEMKKDLDDLITALDNPS